MKGIRFSVLVTATLCLIAPTAGRSEMMVAGGGGVYVPYNGGAGFNVLAQFLGKSQNSGWRFGGELEYRNFKGEIFDVDDVHIDSICLRGLVEYEFDTEYVRPYVGGGFGVTFNIYDGDKVEDNTNLETITDFGTGLGLLALVGAEVPIGSSGFALFAEARAGAEFQLTDDSDDIDVASLGGFGGVGGIRFRF